MSIRDWSDEQLSNLEANYRRLGENEGGPYSLSEVLLEKRRRSFGTVNPKELMTVICELSKSSVDGLLTYGEIWGQLRPNEPWKANYSRTQVSKWLDGVIGYCVENSLPIVTVLVVRGDKRLLSDQAKHNIYAECQELGFKTQGPVDSFIEKQVQDSLDFAKKHQC